VAGDGEAEIYGPLPDFYFVITAINPLSGQLVKAIELNKTKSEIVIMQ
jgi:hypothetical protein